MLRHHVPYSGLRLLSFVSLRPLVSSPPLSPHSPFSVRAHVACHSPAIFTSMPDPPSGRHKVLPCLRRDRERERERERESERVNARESESMDVALPSWHVVSSSLWCVLDYPPLPPQTPPRCSGGGGEASSPRQGNGMANESRA